MKVIFAAVDPSVNAGFLKGVSTRSPPRGKVSGDSANGGSCGPGSEGNCAGGGGCTCEVGGNCTCGGGGCTRGGGCCGGSLGMKGQFGTDNGE